MKPPNEKRRPREEGDVQITAKRSDLSLQVEQAAAKVVKRNMPKQVHSTRHPLAIGGAR